MLKLQFDKCLIFPCPPEGIASTQFRRQKRSHSDLLTEWLAVTNKGRMPYQIPHIRSE